MCYLISVQFQVALVIKSAPASAEEVRSVGSIPGPEDPLEKGMLTHSSIFAWEIPWTEEPGGLQSIGSQRVRHDWATSLSFFLSFFLSGINYSMQNLQFFPSPIFSKLVLEEATIGKIWMVNVVASVLIIRFSLIGIFLCITGILMD